MGDIYCAQCGEPWDAYGVRHGDMTTAEADKFRRGLGCPACHFGTTCTQCGGVGRVNTDCSTCHNSGRVFVRTTAKRVHWEFGYKPNVRQIDYEPFREDAGYMNDYEGWVRQGAALCPDCLHVDGERGEVCPACSGTGKLVVEEDAWETAVQSAIEESDEEPIGILEGYMGSAPTTSSPRPTSPAPFSHITEAIEAAQLADMQARLSGDGGAE